MPGRGSTLLCPLASLIALLPLLALLGGCTSSTDPSLDACAPDEGDVSNIVLGEVLGDFPDGSFTFEPWGEAAPVNVVRGGQGADMIFAGVLLEGAVPPTCAEVRFDVSIADGGAPIAAQTDLLRTVALPDGRRSTGPTQLVLGAFPNSGEALVVRAEALGQQTEARVLAGMPRPPAFLPTGLSLSSDGDLTRALAVGDVVALSVDLGEPAPSGGATVTLGSLDESVVSLDVTELLIPQGQSLGAFEATAVGVGTTNVEAAWDGLTDAIPLSVE